MQNADYDDFIKKTAANQPVINIATFGGVTNGKSTLVEKISHEKTQRHSDEQINNITIKLGYANAKIYKCPDCPKPECYQSTGSSYYQHLCCKCNTECEFIIHISFTDCPGHHLYMATMLNGTCVIDGAILVEAATNEKIPQIQSIEHFEVAHEAGIPISLVCLNKLDLMVNQKNKVPDIIKRMTKFIELHDNKIPIIPISGTMGINIDVVIEYLANFKIPTKNLNGEFKMLIIRSFNINKEKTKISELKGGVIGGSVVCGTIRTSEELTIYPGYISMNDGVWSYSPLRTKAISINSGKTHLDYAIQGGLIGIQLDIDSAFTTSDKLIGNVVFPASKQNVKVYEQILLQYKKMERKITEYFANYSSTFSNTDVIQININANNVICKIISFDNNTISLLLDKPICLEIGDLVTISKMCNNTIEIYGKGIFVEGKEAKII